MNDIAAEILAIIGKIAPDVDLAAVDPAVPLPEQLDLDSMDYQTLLARLAARYAVDIPEVDVPGLRSVDDLAAYLDARIARATRARPEGGAPP